MVYIFQFDYSSVICSVLLYKSARSLIDTRALFFYKYYHYYYHLYHHFYFCYYCGIMVT